MRRASALLFLVASVSALAFTGACAPPSHAGDCGSKVPPEAQRVFDDLVRAFRAANAKGIVGLMEKGDDARILLALQDVPRKPYLAAHALGILENTYFKKHVVTSLTETKDCPKGEGASFTRSFLLTTRTDAAETSEHLTVRVHRIDVEKDGKKSSYWFLESLISAVIPRK